MIATTITTNAAQNHTGVSRNGVDNNDDRFSIAGTFSILQVEQFRHHAAIKSTAPEGPGTARRYIGALCRRKKRDTHFHRAFTREKAEKRCDDWKKWLPGPD